MSGSSAGGNLAAVVALAARDRGGPPLSYQLLIVPVIDSAFDTPSYRENAEGYGLTSEGMRWYWRHYLARPEDGANPLASPLRTDDLSGLPPALVITAEYDPLRDEGEAYAAALSAAGTPATLRRFPGFIHAFINLAGVSAACREAVAEIAGMTRALFANVPAADHSPALRAS